MPKVLIKKWHMHWAYGVLEALTEKIMLAKDSTLLGS
jgi:hypothetical protein